MRSSTGRTEPRVVAPAQAGTSLLVMSYATNLDPGLRIEVRGRLRGGDEVSGMPARMGRDE